MIKSQLIARLRVRHPSVHPRDVERVVSIILDSISQALIDGNRVELRGFGAFAVKLRRSHMSRNPRNNQPVFVDEKRALLFRAGKDLRERLNAPRKASSGEPN